MHKVGTEFRFANYYADHMVLQRAPKVAIIWGYVPNCDPVEVTFSENGIQAKITPVSGQSKSLCHENNLSIDAILILQLIVIGKSNCRQL